MMKQFILICCILLLYVSQLFGQNCSANYQYSFNYLTVSFVDSSFSNSGNLNYLWNFGNGNFSALQNPTHTYASSGTYNVCLTISDSICTDSICYNITVSSQQNCNADFYFFTNGLNVRFRDTSTISGNVNYSWSFGDGNFSNSKHPIHNYQSNGSYIVRLSIFDSLSNCSSQKFDTINVVNNQNCMASFSIIVNNDTLRIQNLATNFNQITYNFGDGTSSNLENPTHVYANNGNYLVCQTITDTNSNCTDTFCDSIYINIPPPCKAGFTVNVQSNIVNIQNFATSYTSISYDFGDGFSTGQENPSHTYAQNGTYIITQTVSNNSGCSSILSDTVNIQLPCIAGFSKTVNLNVVDIQNQAQNFNTIMYDFGDGVTSNIENPTHIYQNSGTYIICQTVSNGNGCTSTICDTLNIRVMENCKAGFNVTTNNDTTQFTSNSQSHNRSIYYFGDGDSSFIKNPTHSYVTSGTYLVKHIVFNDTINCSDTISQNITISVSTSCFAQFSIALDTNNKKTLYLINNSSSDLTSSYFWDFGDGNTSTQKNPTHQYLLNKPYNICLTVYDSSQNCTSTYCDSVGLDSNGNILKSGGFNLTVIDGGAIGLEEISYFEDLKVFPNPFSIHLNISIPLSKYETNFTLYNLNGKLLRNGKIINEVTELMLNNIPKGIYLLHIENKKESIVKKIIKQ